MSISFELSSSCILGLALAPWGVLAAGRIRSDEEEERRRQTGENGQLLRPFSRACISMLMRAHALGRTSSRPDWERTPDEKKMSHALEKVAKEVGGGTTLSAGMSSPRILFCLCLLGC